ncbi:MAG: shikimate kinase 1 [Candidatus Westeberhardia cardiocondylae]|nr:shikimate kinase 1 [Candidatus Westeberhardia cardiocondylae]
MNVYIVRWVFTMLRKNVFLIGPMGAGKSTVGKKLSDALNVNFFDSDYEIERSSGVDISWIFDVEGEQGFRNREIKMIKDLVLKRGIVLSTGGGAITSLEVRNLLVKYGVVIYLNISLEEQLFRTRYDKKRPLLLECGKDRSEILKKLLIKRSGLYSAIADLVVDVNKKSVRVIVDKIMKFLVENRFFVHI